MQNVSDILPLFRTPTWPSHHISERQENDCSNEEKQLNYTCGILFGAVFDVVFETTTTRSHSRKSFLVRLHDMKSIRSDQVKGHCSYLTTWPTWIICKTLNLLRSSISMWRFLCNSRRRFPKSLMLKGGIVWIASISNREMKTRMNRIVLSYS